MISKPVSTFERYALGMCIYSWAYMRFRGPGHKLAQGSTNLGNLYTHIKKLSLDPDELSQMEKTTLLEALVLISNEFKDYTKQSAFVADILAHVRSIWLSDAVKE